MCPTQTRPDERTSADSPHSPAFTQPPADAAGSRRACRRSRRLRFRLGLSRRAAQTHKHTAAVSPEMMEACLNSSEKWIGSYGDVS